MEYGIILDTAPAGSDQRKQGASAASFQSASASSKLSEFAMHTEMDQRVTFINELRVR